MAIDKQILNHDGTQIMPLRWFGYKVLPAVYDDALSYMELLQKVLAKLNEMIDVVNAIGDDYKAYVDAEVKRLDDRITSLDKRTQEDLVNLKAYTDREIKTAIALLESRISEKLGDLYLLLQNNNSKIMAWVEVQIELLRSEIGDITQMWVINPINGNSEPINKVLGDLYNVLRYGALSAAEYDSLRLTSEYYDKQELSAWYYDIYGKEYFYKLLNQNRMYDPFTGEWVEVKNVIYELADLHRFGINAQNYDALQLQAAAFDAMQTTAREYDWDGISRFFPDILSGAPTAAEYDGLGLTAYEYDKLRLTAFTYDFNGSAILQQQFAGTITALGYDQLALTADLYDQQELTAYYYDYMSYRYFMGFGKNIITAQRYDELGLTATEYDNKQITAQDYDDNSQAILG